MRIAAIAITREYDRGPVAEVLRDAHLAAVLVPHGVLMTEFRNRREIVTAGMARIRVIDYSLGRANLL